MEVNGYELPPPTIQFKEEIKAKGGVIWNKSELYKPHKFKNWVFVYSLYNKKDFEEAVNAELYLREASKTFGIVFENPTYI